MCVIEDGWRNKWVKSEWKSSEGKAGKFKHTAGNWPGDPDDRGFFLFNFPNINFSNLSILILKHLR